MKCFFCDLRACMQGLGRSRRPGEGSWKMRGGLWNEWDRKWQGRRVFNGQKGVALVALCGWKPVRTFDTVQYCHCRRIGRLKKGNLKSDLQVSVSRGLWAVSISCSRLRGMNWGLCRGDRGFSILGCLEEVTRGRLDKRGSLPVRAPRDLAWHGMPIRSR
jgi:hypothetical protein